MKILYIGTACSHETFEIINNNSKYKASAAPQHFQTLLLKGLAEKEEQIEVFTFLPMGHYPISPNLIIRKEHEDIFNNLKAKILPAINLIGIKQLCYMIQATIEFIKWNWKNRKEKERAIIIYGMYLPVSLPLVLLNKFYGSSLVTYVNDLPDLMFKYTRQRGIKGYLIPLYNKLARFVYDKFDGYILVSKQLGEVVNLKKKPSIVVEAFANVEDSEKVTSRKHKKAIMYAGTIHRQFGIDKLLYAFEKIKDPKLELWIFGTGDMEDEIINASNKDKRILYFGMKPWEEVLEYERNAILLVNPRFSQDEYTKFSFPSKTMEYMLSGTPVLMTQLMGMDDEYFKYVYVTRNETVDGWKNAIEKVLSLSENELEEKGEAARQFIIKNKTLQIQTEKIINFLKKLVC